jgi:adenylate cyclase class IV
VARNIEIKARSSDVAAQERIAARLADRPPVLMEQRDTFFHVPRGRLKLRELSNGTGELIAYERPDSPEPVQATYIRCPASEPHALKAALAAALGVRAVVRKRRTLFLADQARIHLDEVAGLGRFIELEIVLGADQSEAAGRVIAERLMTELGIKPSDLIASAYVDLLEKDAPEDGGGAGLR